MNESKHSILCVDDEENILNALKRLLHKEKYRILTAGCGEEGLQLLEENEVNLVICDQRMPNMNGTEFLAQVKERFPDIIRIVLTGYTEVDAIMESINKGHIYKFILKPWNDQNLKLEIKQGLEQYELIKANRMLHEKVMMQNLELINMNLKLESTVQERTADLEIKNQALELTQAMLEDVPVPVIGIGSEGMIVFINHSAAILNLEKGKIEIGGKMTDFFPEAVTKGVKAILNSHSCEVIQACQINNQIFNIIITPLSGRFYGQGVILTLQAPDIR